MQSRHVLLQINNHQNLWNVLVISPNSKFWYRFHIKLAGEKCELRTANKYPHTYLFAHPQAKLRYKSDHEQNIIRYMAYMKAIPTHSLHKWDIWRCLTCFLGLLKSGTALETKSSSQFHILAT
jgi:hypothetical protein